jgi:hypothetical protein
MRVARPHRNFIQRAIATDAHLSVGIDRADFYAGGFDGLEGYGHRRIISVKLSAEPTLSLPCLAASLACVKVVTRRLAERTLKRSNERTRALIANGERNRGDRVARGEHSQRVQQTRA